MTTPEQITSCCAVAYSSDAVALPLGDSYHPGGAALTHPGGVLGLRPGLRVADIASGPGATVDGVDYAAAIVAAAREAAEAASPRHNRAAGPPSAPTCSSSTRTDTRGRSRSGGDFLIGPDGRVMASKRGQHAYDQWSVDELDAHVP